MIASRLFLVVTAACALFCTDGAIALPSCAPPIEAANVQVMRAEPNGAVVLTDGRAIKLEGILLPSGARDHAPQFLANQAVAELDDLVRDKLITLAARPPKEDRYGRVRAQAFGDDGNWLQVALLRKGLARVFIAPDRDECVAELFAAERDARAHDAGIWSQLGYEIRNAGDVPRGDLGTFQIVQGKVTNAEIRGGRAYINFGADWKTDFTASIAPEDLKTFRAAGTDPRAYSGKILRVRGIVEYLKGPEIEVPTPSDIEIVSDEAKSH